MFFELNSKFSRSRPHTSTIETMCNTLVDEPEDSSSRRNKKLSVGSCYMQGWCNLLMNAHTYLISLHEDPNASFFGIYDGHGGDAVSKYASRYLHKHIVQRPEYKRNDIEMALKQVRSIE